MNRTLLIHIIPCLLALGCGQKSPKKETSIDPEPRISRLIDTFEHSNSDAVMIIAHRGDWRHAPENSVQAIKNCIDMGVDMVEIDVRMTSDSVLVLMHDQKIDRTTTGSGYIREFTYDSLQSFFLKDNLQNVTTHKIPTLEEALMTTKDEILVNLDTKDYRNLSKYYALLQKTKTLDQVIIKAPIPKNEALSIFGDYLNEIYFMPLVRTAKPGAMKMVKEYQENDPPVAFEFTIPSDTTALLPYFKTVREHGSRVWVNSLSPEHCVGHNDELAASDVSVYDWFINNHINMIQTDRPVLLLNYLRAKDLHE